MVKEHALQKRSWIVNRNERELESRLFVHRDRAKTLVVADNPVKHEVIQTIEKSDYLHSVWSKT